MTCSGGWYCLWQSDVHPSRGWLFKTQSMKALGLRKLRVPDRPTRNMITETERDAAPCDGKHEIEPGWGSLAGKSLRQEGQGGMSG